MWRVVIPDLQNPFFVGLVAAIEEAASRHGASIVLSDSDERLDREEVAIGAAIGEQAAGVVIACASETKSSVEPLEAVGIPVVLVDRRIRGYSGDAVFIDNRKAGELAAEHLMSRGCRRAACIAGRTEVSATEDRLLGFRDALREGGVELREDMVRRTDRRVDRGEASLRSLMRLPEPPDAIYVTSEPLTAGVFKAAQDEDLRMPDDLALIGTDDAPWMDMVRPGVTTVRQPVEQIGLMAGDMIVRRSKDPPPKPPERPRPRRPQAAPNPATGQQTASQPPRAP
jgi:LacI family transcriptional regulator